MSRKRYTKLFVVLLILSILSGCVSPFSQKEKTTEELEYEYIYAIGGLCDHLILSDEYEAIIEYYPILLTSSDKFVFFEENNEYDNITPQMINNSFWFQLMIAEIRSGKISDVIKDPLTYYNLFCGGDENNYVVILSYIEVAQFSKSEVLQLISVFDSFTTIVEPKEQILIISFEAQLYSTIEMEKEAEAMRDKAYEIQSASAS